VNPWSVLSVLGYAISFYGLLRYLLSEFLASGPKQTTWALVAAGGCLLSVVAVVMLHRVVPEVTGSGAVAVWIWIWWNQGGGDGTRKRIRQAKDRMSRIGRRLVPVPV
jgi:hypothetical protein